MSEILPEHRTSTARILAELERPQGEETSVGKPGIGNWAIIAPIIQALGTAAGGLGPARGMGVPPTGARVAPYNDLTVREAQFYRQLERPGDLNVLNRPVERGGVNIRENTGIPAAELNRDQNIASNAPEITLTPDNFNSHAESARLAILRQMQQQEDRRRALEEHNFQVIPGGMGDKGNNNRNRPPNDRGGQGRGRPGGETRAPGGFDPDNIVDFGNINSMGSIRPTLEQKLADIASGRNQVIVPAPHEASPGNRLVQPYNPNIDGYTPTGNRDIILDMMTDPRNTVQDIARAVRARGSTASDGEVREYIDRWRNYQSRISSESTPSHGAVSTRPTPPQDRMIDGPLNSSGHRDLILRMMEDPNNTAEHITNAINRNTRGGGIAQERVRAYMERLRAYYGSSQ